MIGIMSDEILVDGCDTVATTTTTTATTTARWDEYSSIVDVDRSNQVKGEVFRSMIRAMTGEYELCNVALPSIYYTYVSYLSYVSMYLLSSLPSSLLSSPSS